MATSGSSPKAAISPCGNRYLGIKIRTGSSTKLLRDFLQGKFPEGKAMEVVVGDEPVAWVMETTTADRILLVGDATHHTDSITGRGILNAMRIGTIAGEVVAKAIVAGDVTKAGLKEYEDRWRAAIGMNLERSYEYKESFIKLHDEDLNKLLGPLATEDISKMDMRGVLRGCSKCAHLVLRPYVLVVSILVVSRKLHLSVVRHYDVPH